MALSDQERAREALTTSLRKGLSDDAAAAMRGRYVARLEDNLLPGTPVEAVVEAYSSADGGELEGERPKLHAAHSSAALAANAFGPFVEHPERLRIAGLDGFTEVALEKQLRIFRGGTAPNLDAVAASNDLLVAVESKLTEHLGRRSAPKVSSAYGRPEVRALLAGGWTELLDQLLAEGAKAPYEQLDAEQLLKHAIGVAKQAEGRRAVLVYLFWEPAGEQPLGAVERHRREVDDLRARLGDQAFPPLVPISYAELLDEWERPSSDDAVRTLVDRLRDRYSIEVV